MNQPSNPIANTDRRDFLKVSLGLALRPQAAFL